MRLHRFLLAVLTTTACTAPALAQAQSGDVIVMRKTLVEPGSVVPGSGNGGQPGGETPGGGAQGPTPGWHVGPYSAGSSCSNASVRTREVECRIIQDGTITVLPDGQCPAPVPARTETVADFSGCTYAWDAAQWSEWSSGCSNSATRTRTVSCQRSDGASADEALCTGTKPDASEGPLVNHAGCGYAWHESGWGSWSSTCTQSATRTQTVTCRRSDGETVEDSFCNNTKPATSQTGPASSGCTQLITDSGHTSAASWTYGGGAYNHMGSFSVLRSVGHSVQQITWASATSGQTYRLAWRQDPHNWSGSPGTHRLTITSNGQTLHTGIYGRAYGQSYTVNIVGTGTPVTVRFENTADPDGIRIDNVTLSVLNP